MKKSLVVYGGAFNPLTTAHRRAIKRLADVFSESTVVLVPSGARFINQWKPGQEVIADLARLDALSAFIAEAGLKNVEIDTSAMVENICTYDLLCALKAKYAADEARFVIGEDKLEELPRWGKAAKLIAEYEFVVIQYTDNGRRELTLEGIDSPLRVEYVRMQTGTELSHASLLREEMAFHSDAPAADIVLGPIMTQFPECVRIAACSPEVVIGNPELNARALIACVDNTDADILVFPELFISGYTAADMFLSAPFLDACGKWARYAVKETAAGRKLIFFGCPVRVGANVYDCAIAAQAGKILAVIPKLYPANHDEFSEGRWFTSGAACAETSVRIDGEEVPFGADILIRERHSGVCVAAEVGSDAFAPMAPGMRHCLSGAQIIVNTAASNDIVGRAEYRRKLLETYSMQGVCAYAYASSGIGESTGDAIFGGHRLICANGRLLAQARRVLGELDGAPASATVDTAALIALRLRAGGFSGSAGYRTAEYDMPTYRFPPHVSAHPFLPDDEEEARRRCLEILNMQAMSLEQRMRSIHAKKLVVGISGGLDSTLALLVAHTAFRAMDLPDENIVAVTMPCFATSDRTLKNATDLCMQLNTDFRKVDISEACRQHNSDIGHDISSIDVTYENIQARERTQVLMDIANMEGAFVLGTGDLSELALGWCTYNGDHMSHYDVNADVPKTLVRHVVRTYAHELATPETRDTLISILETEITPELVPGGAPTEERIGKYDLHDFYLYYFGRYGFDRVRLRAMAAEAFGIAALPEIEKTLDIFMKRYFQNQFKRSCLSDGPKIGTVGISPRGDLHLPSDGANNWFVRG